MPTPAPYLACDHIDSPAWQTTLEAGVNACPPGTFVHVLVDTAFDHGKPLVPALKEAVPVYGRDLAALQAVSPRLLTLTAPPSQDKRLHALLRHRGHRPMLSAVLTALDAETLIAQWQDVLACTTQDGQRFLLRFADTRVQPALAAHLQAGAWAGLSHGVLAWLTVGRDGAPLWLLSPGQLSSSKDEREMPFRDEGALPPLTITQWAALLADSLPDTVLDALMERVPDMIEQGGGAPRASQVHAWAASACGLAEQHGLESLADQMALTAVVLLTHGKALGDPRLPGLLAQQARQKESLADALEVLLP